MKTKNWFNYNEKERIEKVFSKFKIEDFWNFWANNQQKVMEIRIKNKKIIKQLCEKYNFPYSPSGVYVKNAQELKLIISKVRNEATMWFGIQPRKKNFNKFGWKTYGGLDTNIDEITFIFIDIDRKIKVGQASKLDLEHADYLANKILERFATKNFNNSFIKICSGNGLQLLIKLDVPIKVVDVDFDVIKNNDDIFYKPIENKEYVKIKDLLRNGVGNQILKFSKKIAKQYFDDNGIKLNAVVDKSVFNIGRVGALPVTKNYKYDSFTWRGVVELKEGANTGLSDYVLYVIENSKKYTNDNIFTKSRALRSNNRFVKGKIKEHLLIRFMLDNDLPYGMINNYLWFQVKCIARDSNVFNTSEFKKLHRELETKFNGMLSLNVPDNKFKFDENIVNKFCMDNLIKPLYKLWPTSKKRFDSKIEDIKWNNILESKQKLKIYDGSDIDEDMKILKNILIDGDYNNIFVFIGFVKGCREKYGDEKTKYYFENVFMRWFCWIC